MFIFEIFFINIFLTRYNQRLTSWSLFFEFVKKKTDTFLKLLNMVFFFFFFQIYTPTSCDNGCVRVAAFFRA